MSSDSWNKIQYLEFKCSMPHANGISKQCYECCRSEANRLSHHITVERLSTGKNVHPVQRSTAKLEQSKDTRAWFRDRPKFVLSLDFLKSLLKNKYSVKVPFNDFVHLEQSSDVDCPQNPQTSSPSCRSQVQ